ncbi:MAG: hypothetical protein HN542_02555 [Flavobacteriales bacterium]|nr:hypothetical protein [Flavobacteriales bacterium]MBT3963904.1 hypothetical protein [Flavobacteriales bacterium]MBT4705328.1 hypothetical protein [Flavobacteriales bacterium]MBT4929921.1 hypothetical protein [Flavobacteriales bacterium]MBT5132295.1 hypothetical protein [Flavobacteriales bacterium]
MLDKIITGSLRFESSKAHYMKIRTILTSVAFTFLAMTIHLGAQAQDTLQATKPDIGVTANVTGLIQNISFQNRADLTGSPLLYLRFVQSDRITWRIGISPNVSSISTLTTDSVGKDLVEFDSTFKQSAVGFRPGVEFHFEGTRRLDPYIGVEAELGIVGKQSIGSVTNTTDTTGTSRLIRTITEDGGYTLGARLSLGANYFVAKKLLIGLEYGMGMSSIVTGGDRQEVIQIEPVSGSNVTISNPSSTRSTATYFRVDPMVQFTIGYFFSL